ncbi:hypothetical protein [Tepidibacillus decaturensis]|uniref:Uncharacterized protein n=1 Tax=Tepidibacillus decaturensis TaxID=1413211 RepID=A0A135L2G5_9BACI|nr:hypothetical protein [Tepidibacillus decaturensis]KXG43201.1 hypothetical protein U473_03595 [Tepidibacillus decaturensis]
MSKADIVNQFFFANILERIVLSLGKGREDYFRALSKSSMQIKVILQIVIQIQFMNNFVRKMESLFKNL